MAEKLTQLTPEQEKLIEDTKNEWINFILHSGDDVDKKAAEKGAKWLYKFCGFKEPTVYIVDSPLAAQKKANDLAGNTEPQYFNYSYESLAQSAGWTAYVDIFTKLGVVKDENFEQYRSFLRSGNFMSIYLEGHAIICRRPLFVKFNDRGQLHSTETPAIAWKDKYSLYFLNGVPVSEEIVMTPPNKLDPTLVVKEKNAEVRRELVRKIGVERIYQKLGGKTEDEWNDYQLITLSVPGMRVVPKYLVMKNPSIGTFHMEGVDPTVKTVKEALAWRDSDTEGYIQPDILT